MSSIFVPFWYKYLMDNNDRFKTFGLQWIQKYEYFCFGGVFFFLSALHMVHITHPRNTGKVKIMSKVEKNWAVNLGLMVSRTSTICHLGRPTRVSLLRPSFYCVSPQVQMCCKPLISSTMLQLLHSISCTYQCTLPNWQTSVDDYCPVSEENLWHLIFPHHLNK